MGIQGLTKLLADQAPGCIKETKFEHYFGRKIAVDASMHIYSFLVVVGRTGDQTLTTTSGEDTSHLQGMFYRTVRMLESGMKPVFVFEGSAPELKREELNKRSSKREDATGDLEAAKESGNAEDVEKYSKRTVRVTRQHNEDCKQLLRLMGVPVLDAPTEAEAQCAVLCKEGLVYGMATEDMDSLTFGAPRLIRHLMAPASQKQPVMEFDHKKVLEELELTEDEFIDLCILCGCDYTSKIPGIGPVRALALIKKHGCIEKILDDLDKDKYKIPEPFPYQEARRLFKEPGVLAKDAVPELKWTAPNTEGLIQFLVHEKDFNETRVRPAIDRILKAKNKASQGRLDSFFTAMPGSSAPKRKEAPAEAAPAAKKKGMAGGIFKKK